MGFDAGAAVQLMNQLIPVICRVLGFRFGWVLFGAEGRLVCFCFLTHSLFDPLGEILKQNVQLIEFQSCKTFILGIKAHAHGST